MKIRDVMTRSVASVDPNKTVVEAAQLMQKHNVGSIPVCDGDRLVGIVTDRDIVVRNIAHGKDPNSTPVRDVMTSQVFSVSPDTDLSAAAELMAEHQIRRLPVVDGGRLAGMVALGDLATQAVQDVELAKTLGEISEPSRPTWM